MTNVLKKKWTRKILIFLGILAALFLLINLGINWWLQKKLPAYIKNNTQYTIKYQNLDVDLGTGIISATKISVAPKNPNNQNVIGVEGSVDSLKIARLGLFDAIFNKKISTSDLLMTHPNLKITFAKPVDDKTGKERNPIKFKNLRIKDGNITIYRHTKQKFLSVKKLQLEVSNLQLTEKSVERKLPVVFDKYDINGQNFYFRPDNVYALKAGFISTNNGLVEIQNFHWIPLLSFSQFQKYYPQKNNLFDVETRKMTFKDIQMGKNKISLSDVVLDEPNIKIHTGSVKSVSTKKDFTYDVNLENLQINRAKIEILKEEEPLFTAKTIDINIEKMKMDEETAKQSIPFSYSKFLIGGKNLNYLTPQQEININALSIQPKSIESRGITVKPRVSVSSKTLLDLSLNQILVNLKDWKFENKKLALDVENITLNALNGKLISAKTKEKKKTDLRSLALPLKVKRVILKNSNFTVDGDEPLVFKNLQANLQNIEMNEETIKNKFPFQIGSYDLTTNNFNYGTEFYNINAAFIKIQKGNFVLNNFMMKPKVSRAQFIKMIPVEKDLYDISAKQISGKGSWDFFSQKKSMNLSNILLNGVDANIFRSKVPKDDPSIKKMYSELLRSIKFPLFVGNLDIKNSILEYEEDTEKSDGPGKLIFGNFNLNVKNLNSGKMAGKPTVVPITIKTSFMNASPMNVKWSFDTSKMDDDFSISGNVADLPASRINPFIEPYLKIRATGSIQNLVFNFRGSKTGINGSVNMKHKDLKVAVLKKDSKEENKLLSAVANIFVKTTSDKYPESVTVDDVKRDPTKSFFNLFWKGIEEGLKKTLIGRNFDKQQEAAKKAVSDVKSDFQDVKKNIKKAIEPKKQTEKKEEKGFLRGLFKKKEKAEN